MAGFPFESEDSIVLNAKPDLRLVNLPEVFASSLQAPVYGTESPATPQHPPSYLNYAVRCALDPLSRWTTSYERASDDVVAYTSAFIKTVPLFMRGRLALSGLALGYMSDEIRIGDNRNDQIVDAGLGLFKAGMLKGTFNVFSRAGATPGLTGMGLGISNRLTDSTLTRRNYYDIDGNFSLAKGLRTAASVSLNPTALAIDMASFGAADVLWARLFNWSRGNVWYKPPVTHAITGGTMGVSTGFAYELHNQMSSEGPLDFSKLARSSLMQGTFDALAGAVGGYQSQRHMRLNLTGRDSADAVSQARATPFQRGEHVDTLQAGLRDGDFILERKLPGLTTDTWVGWTLMPDGVYVRSIFRPNDGTESFAHRMQSEIAAYGLQKLGFKANVPVTVARRIENHGKISEGYIQEMEGTSLADFLRQSVPHAGKEVTRKELVGYFKENPSISESYTDAWLHRMIMGEWDNHALNMTVRQPQSGAPQVRNIDLGDGLKATRTELDITPTPGVRQGYDRFNSYLYDELAGKALPKQSLSTLTELYAKYSTPAGFEKLQSVGLTAQQATGVLGRTRWFIDHGYMPRGQEAMFYLNLNDARRAVERWLGHGKGQPESDPTNYYQSTHP